MKCETADNKQGQQGRISTPGSEKDADGASQISQQAPSDRRCDGTTSASEDSDSRSFGDGFNLVTERSAIESLRGIPSERRFDRHSTIR